MTHNMPECPRGEIKLPDTRLHHFRARARRMEGQRVFNHACFTGPLRLVKSWWPLMTKGMADMMKRNGPRGERIGGWGLAGEEDEDAIVKRRLARFQVKLKNEKRGGGVLFPVVAVWLRLEHKVNFHHAMLITCSCTTYRVAATSVASIQREFTLFCSYSSMPSCFYSSHTKKKNTNVS